MVSDSKLDPSWIQVLIGKSEHPSCETLFLGCDLSQVSNFADFVFYIVTSATVPAPDQMLTRDICPKQYQQSQQY